MIRCIALLLYQKNLLLYIKNSFTQFVGFIRGVPNSCNEYLRELFYIRVGFPSFC